MFLWEKVSEINNKLTVLRDISNIIIWGAGMHTCKLFECTNIMMYDLKGIVDK